MFKVIEKQRGQTSLDAIKKFQKEHKIKKIGHTGTLDPLAQGLLLVATDDYTKLIPYIKNKDKEYLVEATLGFISRTYDAEGPITFFSDYIPNENEVRKKIKMLMGTIKQYPPIYSAKKVGGKRSYELARKNQEVVLEPNEVTIYTIEDLKYEYPLLSFKTKVSNGTYIRSLVHDLGKLLNTGAYLTFLERIMVNGLHRGDEVNLHQLLQMESIIIDKEQLQMLKQGKKIAIERNNGSYLLEYKKIVIGLMKLGKIKLFGHTINQLLGE